MGCCGWNWRVQSERPKGCFIETTLAAATEAELFLWNQSNGQSEERSEESQNFRTLERNVLNRSRILLLLLLRLLLILRLCLLLHLLLRYSFRLFHTGERRIPVKLTDFNLKLTFAQSSNYNHQSSSLKYYLIGRANLNWMDSVITRSVNIKHLSFKFWNSRSMESKLV